MYTVGMVHALLACLVLQTPAPYLATRYDLGVRLEALDAAWVATKSSEAKAKAVPAITRSVMAFFGGRTSDAAKALDEARSALQGREPQGADAVTVTVWPPVAAGGDEVEVRFRLCYAPAGAAMKVRAGSEEAAFGDQRAVAIPWEVPDGPPGRVAIKVWAGGVEREVTAYRHPEFLQRLERLLGSDKPEVGAIAEGLKESIEGRAESHVHLVEQLAWAEALQGEKGSLRDREEARFAKQGGTRLRAWVPKGAKHGVTVVVALHGAGGSENLFFQGYGGGLAVREAQRRGWAFLSPRSGPKAAQDALDWLRVLRGVNPGKVLVIGHSMGGGLALQTGGLQPKPSAVAVLAPAANQIPSDLDGVPVYAAVGAQEIGMIQNMSARIEAQLRGRPGSKSERFDPCEHLMIVAEATPAAFRFFDEALRAGG